jgi:hypothetical protein
MSWIGRSWTSRSLFGLQSDIVVHVDKKVCMSLKDKGVEYQIFSLAELIDWLKFVV